VEDPSKLNNRQRLKFLAKDTALYGGAKALSLAVGFITFPVVAHHFSVADYGLIDMLSVMGAFLATMIVFGQDSAIARYFYEYTDTQVRRQLISQSLLLQILICFIVCLLVLMSLSFLSPLLGDVTHDQLTLLLLLVVMQVPFNVLLSFSQNLLKWSFARKEFMAISLGSTLVSAFGIIIGIAFLGFDIIEVFYTYLMVRFIFGCLGMYFCRQWIVWPQNYKYAREMIPFALPFGLICVIASLVPLMERSLVSRFLGADDLGLFAVGAKVAMLISLPITAFQTAWGPFSLSIHKESNAGATYGTVLKIVTLLLSIAVLALTFMAQPIIQLLASERYMGAAFVVFPLAMGLMIQGVSWITEIGVGISKQARLQLYVYLVYLAATAGAIIILAQVYGLVGVAWGTMFGYTVKSIVTSYFAQRVYPLPWPFFSVVALIFGVALLGGVGSIFQGSTTLVESIGLLIVAILLLFPLCWFFVLNEGERKIAWTMINKLAR
jgi:O-antigen/teichoic acid export membrane protein